MHPRGTCVEHLHTVHPHVPFAALGIKGDHLGKRDKSSSIARPACEHRKKIEVGRFDNFLRCSAGCFPYGCGEEPPCHRTMAPEFRQRGRNEVFNKREQFLAYLLGRSSECKQTAPFARQSIDDHRVRRSLYAFKPQSFASFPNGAPGDFRDLKIRIHLHRHPMKFPLSFEVPRKIPQGTHACSPRLRIPFAHTNSSPLQPFPESPPS